MLRRVRDKLLGWAGLNKKIRKKVSFSQCGEDLIISHVFALRGIENPSYLDFGAHDPFYLSNTAHFYKQGSQGVNVEANPILINAFNKHRPRDTNLAFGVGLEEGVLDFYVLNDSTLSTFNKEEAYSTIELGNHSLKEVIQVPVKPVDFFINEHCGGVFPDLLSLDVEGWDFEILKGIDYKKSSPKVICVEAAEYSPVGAGARREDLISFLKAKGYYEYANTNLNAIMVKEDFWFV